MPRLAPVTSATRSGTRHLRVHHFP
jgi:hypothetical protein